MLALEGKEVKRVQGSADHRQGLISRGLQQGCGCPWEVSVCPTARERPGDPNQDTAKVSPASLA